VQIHIAGRTLDYDGSQLCSQFAYRSFGIQGDSIVCFLGAMDIPRQHIADLEDLLANESIRGSSLLHFIVEHFGITLETAILRQRLLARLAAEIIVSHYRSGTALSVRGDDLFVGAGKLSVSIAAPSPVSCLIHLGLNISTVDVPVEAAGLDDLGVAPETIAPQICQAYSDELISMTRALAKVRGVP